MMPALTSNLAMQDQHRRNSVWKNYFTAGFSYKEIRSFLFLFCFHRTKIAIWDLNRSQGKGNHSNTNTEIKFIQDKLNGSTSRFGYQYMLQKLRSSGLTADKEIVQLILESMDTVGADRRKRQRLTRHEYHSFGPDHTSNIDGYDKLKRFGITIHGALDGYRRRFFGLNYHQAIATLKLLQTITCAVSRSWTSFHVLSEATVEMKMYLYAQYSDSCVEIIPTARVKTQVSFMVTQQQINV